jgi:hypothetical protein
MEVRKMVLCERLVRLPSVLYRFQAAQVNFKGLGKDDTDAGHHNEQE